MEFKKFGRISVSGEIIEYLKQQIISKELKSGSRLPSEEQLASKMGVGRGTIREALRVLTYLGFIERKNRGTYVSPAVPDDSVFREISRAISRHHDIMEMIELRKIIEPEAAALAAKRANAEKLEKIERALRSMDRERDRVEDFIGDDYAFHLSIIEATENNLLLTIIKNIHKLMWNNQALILRFSKDIMPRSIQFHKKVFEAISQQDDNLARKQMQRHVLDIEKEMYVIIREGAKKGLPEAAVD